MFGIDGWSRDDEHADHLAHLVRGVVGDVLGSDVAARTVVASHEVRAERAHLSLSCALPGAAAEKLLGQLLEGLVELVGRGGAVVRTGGGLPDGLARGEDPAALAGAWTAVTAAATGRSGRLVVYPGAGRLLGRLPVAELLAASVVDEVVVVGGAPHDGATVVDTRDFVRPRLLGSRVQLLVQPGAGGVMVPFETEHPHRCCEDH